MRFQLSFLDSVYAYSFVARRRLLTRLSELFLPSVTWLPFIRLSLSLSLSVCVCVCVCVFSITKMWIDLDQIFRFDRLLSLYENSSEHSRPGEVDLCLPSHIYGYAVWPRATKFGTVMRLGEIFGSWLRPNAGHHMSPNFFWRIDLYTLISFDVDFCRADMSAEKNCRSDLLGWYRRFNLSVATSATVKCLWQWLQLWFATLIRCDSTAIRLMRFDRHSVESQLSGSRIASYRSQITVVTTALAGVLLSRRRGLRCPGC